MAFRPSAPRSVRTARALRSHCAGAVRCEPSHCAGAVRKRGSHCDFRSAKTGVCAHKTVRSARRTAHKTARIARTAQRSRGAVRSEERARSDAGAHEHFAEAKPRHECAARRVVPCPWRLIVWWIRSRQRPWAAPPNGGGRTLALTSSRCCRDGDGDGAGWTGGDKPCSTARDDSASVAVRSRLAARRRRVLATCRAAGRRGH